ncbi:uncharacterized protein LOC104933264 isoform X3 [Larimichthys crocea]|nr:uncharacterized protein LOC104933264 isoform X3 [Larimichthys crocea]
MPHFITCLSHRSYLKGLLTFFSTLTGENDVNTVCAGKEYRLPVYSTSRMVTFTPNFKGTRHVLLNKTTVTDPRFEFTRDKMLVLKEVTHADEGLYAIKLSSGFTYETYRLVVSECIKPYHRKYGENFGNDIPENATILEFIPRGAPPEAMPVVLWNRTDPKTSNAGRGQLMHGKTWVAERVTQADQGNYTVRDGMGRIVSRSTLTVHGHSFNVTRFTKESLNLRLFLPILHAHLIFTPNRYPDESSLGPFDPKPPRGPVQLIREGQITDHDLRYRGLISLGRDGTTNAVVISSLTLRHGGLYEIRDLDGNLVSSTLLQVIEKGGKWRAHLKSITAPSGTFLTVVCVIVVLKRYSGCSFRQIITGFRRNRTPPANPPRVNIQDYSQPSPEPSGFYSHSPSKWTPRPSPTHTGYQPVTVGSPQTAESSPNPNTTTEQETTNEDDRKISFPVPGASDCLHSSEDCVQFQIKKDKNKERENKSQDYFSTLPLDTETSESSSVYTSEKLNFS